MYDIILTSYVLNQVLNDVFNDQSVCQKGSFRISLTSTVVVVPISTHVSNNTGVHDEKKVFISVELPPRAPVSRLIRRCTGVDATKSP
jgi:hypothetical protein